MIGLLAIALSPTAIAVHGALLVLAVLLSGLFSAAEAALLSTPAHYRRQLVEEARGPAVAEQLGSANRVFVTVLVGNYLANAGAAVLVASLVLGLTALPLWAALLVALAAAGGTLLALGELVPRAMATLDPDATARRVTGPLALVQTLLYPFLRLFEAFSGAVFGALGAPVQRRVFLDEEELQHLLEVGEEEGVLEEDERDMIASVIELDDADVGDVMVPRTDILAVHAEDAIEEVADRVVETGYSRIPVYQEDLDDIVGVVYGKDLLEAVRQGQQGPVADVVKEALSVPETAPLDETLREMKTRRIHIALVHDEFGGTAGLVTLEDVLEEIVGDIFDEYDPEVDPIEWVGEDKALLDARMDIEQVNEALATSLPEEEGYETLGGYLFHELGRPGRAGETIHRDEVAFTLERVANRRILKVRAELEAPEAGEPSG
jgi:CBS domain containing-hemolysin-like protein